MNHYFDHDPNASILEDIDYKEPEIAGRGFRLLAYLIDYIIIIIIAAIFFALWTIIAPENDLIHEIDATYGNRILDRILSVIFYGVYSAVMESSSLQATIGKRILNMKVCTTEYEPINFKTALKRNFAKIIPFAVLVILFNSRNQGLHDQMADTLVVKRN